MAKNDEPRDTRPRRLIYEMREQAHQARAQFVFEKTEGQQTTRDTKRSLVFAVWQYWDALHEFREENVLDEGEFPDIKPILSRLGQTTAVITEGSGRGRGQTVKHVPAVTELDDWYLLEVTEDLDDISKKLGFGASAREKAPHDDVTHDDLAALLKARGQEEALEKVPGGD